MGKVAPNLLEQKFDVTEPFEVLHTNVIQVCFVNLKWSYLSVITYEATKKLLAFEGISKEF
ncbi:hypothetical protein SN10121_11790 [Ligilactobacillus agilis]|nr:hypothetical protein SN10121_11790 [Ligilactobacillus agilis]